MIKLFFFVVFGVSFVYDGNVFESNDGIIGEKEVAYKILNNDSLVVEDFIIFIKDNYKIINTLCTTKLGYLYDLPAIYVHYKLNYFDFYITKILDDPDREAIPIIIEFFVEGRPFTIVNPDLFLSALLYGEYNRSFIDLIDKYDYIYKQFKKEHNKKHISNIEYNI
jgi:hypothetical protein